MNPYTLFNLIMNEADLDFARSSGAGGQNVNKVNSKVILRWNLWQSHLPAELKDKIYPRISAKLTAQGDLIFTSERFRSQTDNRRDCEEKLLEWLKNSLKIAKPRRKTKPTKASRERRLTGKKVQQHKKKWRSRVNIED